MKRHKCCLGAPDCIFSPRQPRIESVSNHLSRTLSGLSILPCKQGFHIVNSRCPSSHSEDFRTYISAPAAPMCLERPDIWLSWPPLTTVLYLHAIGSDVVHRLLHAAARMCHEPTHQTRSSKIRSVKSWSIENRWPKDDHPSGTDLQWNHIVLYKGSQRTHRSHLESTIQTCKESMFSQE